MTFGDTIFDDPSTGWTDLPSYQGLDIVLDDFFQLRAGPVLSVTPGQSRPVISSPAQLVDLFMTLESPTEISDNWDFSYNDSSSAIPSRAGFVLRKSYDSGTVPKLWFRAHDLDNDQVTEANTTDDAGNFQYSTDDGLTWLSLGTIPNVEGTRIRYTWTTPPGVEVRPSIRES
jgi:hypothetical protein